MQWINENFKTVSSAREEGAVIARRTHQREKLLKNFW